LRAQSKKTVMITTFYIPLENALENLGQTDSCPRLAPNSLRKPLKGNQLEMVPERCPRASPSKLQPREVWRRDQATVELERALALRPEDSSILYNAACVYADSRAKRQDALAMVKKAIQHGYHNLAWLSRRSGTLPILP